MEEVNQGVEDQEVAEPVVTESRQDEQPQEEKLSAPTHEAKQNYAFASMRREKEEWERKARIQEELLNRLAMGGGPQQVKAPPKEDVIQKLAQSQYVSGEEAAQGLRAIKDEFQQELQSIKQMYAQQKVKSSYDSLKDRYKDLEEVVNPETLALVKAQDPQLAAVWSQLDDYSIAVQAYPYIKNMGILEEHTGTKRSREVDQKIEQNKKTVQTPQAFDKRPMAQAFNPERMTKAQKDEVQREMLECSRRGGGSY